MRDGGFDMRHARRRQLLGLSLTCSTLFAAAWGTTAVTATAASGHAARSVMVASQMPGLRPGDRLSLGGVSVIVPPPGQGVWGAAIRIDGPRLLGVHTGLDGSVTVSRRENVEVAGAGGKVAQTGSVAGAAKPLSACSDSAYSLTGTSWNKTYAWRFKAISTPGEITQSDALSALRGALGNLTTANNDCGLSDRVSATSQYNGTTNKPANIGTDSTCNNSDNTSVVDFGNLAALDLGYACWWYMGNYTVSSDMRLNSTEYSWAVNLNGCVAKYSVEDVATHELGHTFGLNDVSESLHPALTMSAIMLPCQNAETTLGLGDVKGMEALY